MTGRVHRGDQVKSKSGSLQIELVQDENHRLKTWFPLLLNLQILQLKCFLPTSTTWTLLSVAAFQLSAGKEVALGGKCQFALYWAEVKSSVRPSVQPVMLSERTRVHVLSLDCNTFNIPSLEEEKKKKSCVANSQRQENRHMDMSLSCDCH